MKRTATRSRILITGAAGKTGTAVLRRLLCAGKALEVRALVHRARHRKELENLGIVDVCDGDLSDRAALARALEGVAAVYHICPNVHPDEVRIGRRLIELARDATVERLVFHSVLHPQTESMPHHWAKLRVEESLFESGLDFTVLQPAPYMQNLLAQWSQITENGVYQVPYAGSTRVVMVDLEDVAEVATLVLTQPGHSGATYELCGPDAPNQAEIARALARHLGRSVRVEVLARAAWQESARAAGLGDYHVETLDSMFRYYERFGMSGSPRVLEQLLGRPPSSFNEFVRRASAGWQPRRP